MKNLHPTLMLLMTVQCSMLVKKKKKATITLKIPSRLKLETGWLLADIKTTTLIFIIIFSTIVKLLATVR